MCLIPKSTIAKKYLMALTGLIMVGFVVGHMAGNLKMFAGVNPETGIYKIDEYAIFLRKMGAPLFAHGQLLWIFRIGLLLAVFFHIASAISLTVASRKARPEGYKVANYDCTTYAARTMRWGGVIISLYIVYHIMHFTLGVVHSKDFEHGWVYSNVYHGFKIWYVTAVYGISMLAVSLHLYHGLWSVVQTIGVDRAEWRKAIKGLSGLLALIVFVGFMAVPACVMIGCIPEPQPYSFILK